METLQKLLEMLGLKEHFDAVKDKLGNKKVVIVEDGQEAFIHKTGEKPIVPDGVNWIPKSRFDEINGQKENLQTQVTTLNKNLSDLKKLAGTDGDLAEKITEMQNAAKNQSDTFKTKEAEMTKRLAIKEHLMNSGVVDSDARDLLVGRFDLAKIQINEEGKIVGWDDLVKPVKENKSLATLFGEVKAIGEEHNANHEEVFTPDANGLFTREQVEKMPQEVVDANLDAVNKSVASWNK